MHEDPAQATTDVERRVPAEVTPLQRALALLALLALLASGAITSWWVLTDRIDFGRDRERDAPVVVEAERIREITIDSEPK